METPHLKLTALESFELFRLISNRLEAWKEAKEQGPKMVDTAFGPQLGYSVEGDFAKYVDPSIRVFESLQAKLKAAVK